MGQKKTQRRRGGEPRQKKLTAQQRIGQQGINLIEKVVLDMGSRWDPTGGTEIGLDGFVELIEPGTGHPTGVQIAVQSKATTRFKGDDKTVSYGCTAEDVEYWLSLNIPVILVYSQPSTGEAYWISVKDYFGAPDRAETRVAVFDRATQSFSPDAYDALLTIGKPVERVATRVPVPTRETLYSNLVPLEGFPESLFVARAAVSHYGEAWARLQDAEKGILSPVWLLHGGNVLSFHDLDEHPFSELVEVGTAEEHSTRDWAESSDLRQRNVFVQLLNRALQDDLGAVGVRYFRGDDMYAFKGRPNERPRVLLYRSAKRPSELTVVQHYSSRSKDGREFTFLRHLAFQGRFREISGQWFLEVTPSYRFTSDGLRKDRFHEDRVAGIKRLEGNRAVLSQFLAWADVLAPEPTLFAGSPRLLRFGKPCTFTIDRGVPDHSWGMQSVGASEGANEAESMFQELGEWN